MKKLTLLLSIISFVLSLNNFLQAQGQDFNKKFQRALDLLQKGEYEESVKQFKKLADSTQNIISKGTCYYNVACGLIKLKKNDEALLYFARSMKNGFVNLRHIESDKDLDPVRKHPLYKYLVGLIKARKTREIRDLDIDKLKKKFLAGKSDELPDVLNKLKKSIEDYIDDEIEKLRKEYYKQIDEMIDRMRKGNKPSKPTMRAYFGVRAQDVNENTRAFFKLAKNEGVLISSVTPGSPAEKAGIHPLDIILKINGKSIKSADKLKEIIANSKVGALVNFVIFRSGNKKRILYSVLLSGKTYKESPKETPKPEKLKASEYGYLGVRLQEVKKGEGIAKSGLQVTSVVEGSPADKAGLKVGDIIVVISESRVKTLEDLKKAMTKFYVGDEIRIYAIRGEKNKLLALKLTIGKRQK